jgi:hypothetical protein
MGNELHSLYGFRALFHSQIYYSRNEFEIKLSAVDNYGTTP